MESNHDEQNVEQQSAITSENQPAQPTPTTIEVSSEPTVSADHAKAVQPSFVDELFSVTGHRVLKFPRSKDVANPPTTINPSEESQRPKTAPSSKDAPSGTRTTRNPLTGEGYAKEDFHPELGIRKFEPPNNEERKNRSRVPPGGYSQGLW